MPNSTSQAITRIASYRWTPRAVVLAALGVFNLVIFNRYLPLSEGWWESYGYLYNAGLRPYRDFDLAYTPLFTMVNAALLRIFGDSFFALRLFGVFVFLAAVALLQLALERLFAPRTAAVATLVSTFLMISQPQFIAKDYHVYQLGLVALALLLHVKYSDGEGLDAAARVRGSVLLGATVCLVFVLKQNVGALLLVAFGAALALTERERPVARCLAYAAGAVLPIVLLLPIVGPSDWRQLMFANDAKGDLSTVLLRFLHPELWAQIVLGATLLGAYLAAWWAVAPPARWRAVWSDSAQALAASPRLRAVAFLVPLALIAASGNALRRAVVPWVIPVTLAVVGVALHQLGLFVIRRRLDGARLAGVALPLVALAYANTTTAAFDVTALQVPVAFALAFVLSVVEVHAGLRGWVLTAALLVIIVPELAAAKLRTPYLWWAHDQAPISKARSEPAYAQLKGMYVGAAQQRVLDDVKEEVDRWSRSRTDALFFNIPILYWLHGKLPPFRTVVHWFDVVSTRQMSDDLRALKEHPPRLVVALEPPPSAFVVHRVVRNQQHLPQEDFWALMDAWVADGTYRLVRSIVVPTSARRDGDPTVQEIVLQNERAIGLTPDEVQALAGGVKIGFRRDAGTDPDCGVAAGEVVTASGSFGAVRALSAELGVARGGPRDWNTVNVYVRADGG